MVTADWVRNRLRAVEDPEFGEDIVSLGLVTDIHLDDGAVAISLAFNAPLSPDEWTMCDEIRALCRGSGLEPRIYADTTHDDGEFHGVKNTVAICGADTDAGTSIVTANLAVELAAIGARVGVLDIGCPDGRGTWLETVGPPELSPESIVPRTAYGIGVVRLATLVPTNESPPTGAAVLDLLLPKVTETLRWGPIDYLLVNLPQATGRNPRRSVEQLPTDGTIVVTPKSADSAVTRALGDELTTVGSTVIGVLETVDTPEVDDRVAETGRETSELDWPFLGTAPLDRCVRPSICDDRSRRVTPALAGSSNASAWSPFRALAVSITDRIGAVNRQSSARRQRS